MIPQIDSETGSPYTFPTVDSAGNPLPFPSRPLNYGVKSSVIVTSFDSGTEQRRVKAPSRLTFDCHYLYLLAEEYAAIRDFYLKVLNCYAFYWTDPLSKTRYTVRFDMDNFAGLYKYQGPKGPGYEVSLKLLQVL